MNSPNLALQPCKGLADRLSLLPVSPCKNSRNQGSANPLLLAARAGVAILACVRITKRKDKGKRSLEEGHRSRQTLSRMLGSNPRWNILKTARSIATGSSSGGAGFRRCKRLEPSSAIAVHGRSFGETARGRCYN